MAFKGMQPPITTMEGVEAHRQDIVNALKSSGTATAGAPGDLEALAVALSKLKSGQPPQIAFGERDGVLPTSDEIAEVTGADLTSPSGFIGSIFSLDPTGPLGKIIGASAPLFMAAIRQGDVDSFVKLVKGLKLPGFTTKKKIEPLFDKAKAIESGENKAALDTVWDGVTANEAEVLARSGVHLRQDPKTGQYVGGPRGVVDEAGLDKNRAYADDMVQRGSHGMGWYDDARREAFELAPGDPNMQTLFGRGGAAYSPQAMPDTETGFFLKQHNAKVLGNEDINSRTESAGNAVRKAYKERGDGGYDIEPYKLKLGEKTGPYADARDTQIPESDLYKTANDIWHGRVMGWGPDFDRGFSPQEHAFLTGENLLLADRASMADKLGGVTRDAKWNPRSAQAATWVAEREDSYIADAVTAAEKKIATDEAWNAQKVAENEAIDVENARRKVEEPKKAQLKHKPMRTIVPIEEQMPEIERLAKVRAGKGIPGAVDRHSAYVTSEARTGDSVNHLKMGDDEGELIQDYTDMVQAIAKRDPVADPMQMFTKDARGTVGEYINQAGKTEKNPGFQNQVLVSSNLTDTAEMMPLDRQAMDMSALIGGILRAQEAGAWSRFMPQGMGKQRVDDMNAWMVDHPGQGPEALTGHVSDAGGSVINYGDQSVVTKFGDYGPEAGTTGALKEAMANSTMDLADARRGTLETGYQDTKLNQPQGGGAATMNLLDQSALAGRNMPGFEARTADEIAGQARAMNILDEEVSRATGKVTRPDLMKLRSILGEGGLPALRDYVRKNGTRGLPAVLLPVLGLTAAGQMQPAGAGPGSA